MIPHKEEEVSEWLSQQPELIQQANKTWPLGSLLDGEFYVVGYSVRNGVAYPLASTKELLAQGVLT